MTRDVTTFPERPSPLWEAHDDPGRPLDPLVQLCACVGCEAAIVAEAARRPRSPLSLATAHDRIVVTAEYLAEVIAIDATLTPLLYVRDDDVRRIFVPVDGWLFPPRRWWSAACHDDETAAGRRHVRHRVAKRQSRVDRERSNVVAQTTEAVAAIPVTFVPLAAAVEPWRTRHRSMLTEMVGWALRGGHPVDVDLVALILAARERGLDDGPIGLLTRTGVHRLLAIDVFNWCSLACVQHPRGVPAMLWRLLDFLVETDRLDAASDPLDELRKPLLCYGGLDRSGRERLDDGAPTIRCECYVAYRGPTQGEVSQRAVPGERDDVK